ncbi:ATP-binding cassette sub-family G member 1-like isoform X2 [Cylas formicarius]|uniref:ATP-binding cassette sub-family G member 1-like isoform X2 n=1 Tax=Cylas formicarius TaxID=197179 RepID=UPI002958D755|nr:ATP-binding cassette sub-family G member 1-like isoform X2 [Cylas formicarius]
MEKEVLGVRGTPAPTDIEFENVWFTVKRGHKKIIKGVSGKFKSGELTAIMGPSGAGKTSLLNILTGFQKSGVEGSIRCGSREDIKNEKRLYQKESCYILQDDHLPDFLTVGEFMFSTMKLKLSGLTRQLCDEAIDDILATLGLYTAKNTPCGNLSGGQRKRLSIALELIDDPPVMFLDEPTTGLDSSSANQCVFMLSELARKGRTVICTIHQPSTRLYMTFNQVYTMADGRCVFRGSPSNTVPYLASSGFVCPRYHNPADFLLEVTSGEYGNAIDCLAKAAQDSKWAIDAEVPPTRRVETDKGTRKVGHWRVATLRKKPSELARFSILLRKQLAYLNRDASAAKLKLFLHFLVGAMLGLTYHNSGYDASKSISNVSFFLVSVVYISYTSLMPAVLRFPSELLILRKELFNRWYTLRTYFISHMAADIPLQIAFALTYTTSAYLISAQPLEFGRFFMVVAVLSMVCISASGMGLIFGALVDPINGTFLGAIFSALLFSLAGSLCLFPHMPRVMYYLTNFSYLSFSMEGVLQAVYGFDRGPLICPSDVAYCLYTSPSELLRDIGMDRLSFFADIAYIALYAVIFRVLAYFFLKRKLMSF